MSCLQGTSLNQEVPQQNGHHIIKFFQASPLAYKEEDTKITRPMEQIDLWQERSLVSQPLKEFEHFSLDFDVATPSKIGSFLAEGQHRILHISCHGHPEYLAIEEAWGELHCLRVAQLKFWLQCRKQALDLVFIASCNSWPVAQLFTEAGVPHVICCQKNQLKSDAADKFTVSFYRNLALGNTVKAAHNLALNELFTYSCYKDERFCLLPFSTDHDVHLLPTADSVFRNLNLRQKRCDKDIISYPQPPKYFIRDDLEVYWVMKKLSKSQLVSITGPGGIGKCALAQTCCQYLELRQCEDHFHNIIWYTLDEQGVPKMPQDHSSCSADDSIFEAFKIAELEQDMGNCASTICTALAERATLLVLDAKKLDDQKMATLAQSLKELLSKLHFLKVIVIHRLLSRVSFSGLPQIIHASESVPKLSIRSSIILFSVYCQHIGTEIFPMVSNGKELNELLGLSGLSEQARLASRRYALVNRLIGNGNPGKICSSASRMTEDKDQYLQLVSLGVYKKQVDQIQSRVQLEKATTEIRQAMFKLHQNGVGVSAAHLDHFSNAISLLVDDFPSIEELAGKLDDICSKIEAAGKERDYFSMQCLQKAEIKMRAQISNEENNLFSWIRCAAYEGKLGRCKPILFASCGPTRASLDEYIDRLQHQLNNAIDERQYDLAEYLDVMNGLLFELKILRPSYEELEQTELGLTRMLYRARSNMQTSVVQIIDTKLKEVRLKKLREARELGIEIQSSKEEQIQKSTPAVSPALFKPQDEESLASVSITAASTLASSLDGSTSHNS